MKRRCLRSQTNVVSTYFNTPAWLRRVLFSSILLLLPFLVANAQTNWTSQFQVPGQIVFDVAYGGGKYVAVGNSGLIQISTDGVGWTTQVAPSQSAGALLGIVYANSQFVAVGSSGRVITSPDGITWASQVSGTTKFLWSIAYGAGRFIAVGDDGTAITSADGIAWTSLTTGTSKGFNDITYGDGQFVAVGDGGMIRTTPNGIIWTARVSGTANDLKGVTIGVNGQFVAVGTNSTVVSSPNGIGWTAQEAAGGTSLLLTSVTYDPAQGLYVAVAETILHQLLRSTDGINWTSGSSDTRLSLYRVRYVNSLLIAVGQLDIILTSQNGINWYPRTISIDIQFNATAYGNGHYIAVGKYPVSISPATGTVAVTSTNGINYTLGTTQHFSGAGEGFNDVAFGNGQFVAVGGEGIIQTSTDGNVWTLRHSTSGASLYGVAYGGGQYVAVGSGLDVGGSFLRSSDGITWIKSAAGANTFYHGITYTNGQFVAVGFNGAIGTSTDGSIWTPRTSGTTNMLNSVAYGNGIYVAVGTGGKTLRSTDASVWTTVATFTGNDLNRVLFANSQFVTVGKNGSIFTSPDGVTWTARSFNSNGVTLNGIGHGNGLFVAVGEEATIVTSPDDSVVPPVNQPPVAPFIADATGTVGQVYSQTIPAFSDPENQPLTYSIIGLPPGLLVIDGGNIVGPPSTAGVYSITVTATDTGGLSANATYTLTINPAGNPGAFAITGVTTVNCQTVSATERHLNFSPQYTGLNGQPISFSVVNEMLPTTKSGPYSLRMYIDNPTITLKATQTGSAGEASYTYNWLAACGVVPPGNQAPTVVHTIPAQAVTQNQPFNYAIPAATFADPNGDALTVSVGGLPAGLLFTAPATISGVPLFPGESIVTVTATDGGNLSVSTQFTLTVNPESMNGSFAITGVNLVSCQTVSATERLLSLTPQYSGLTGQSVSFSVVNEMLPTTNPGPYPLTMYIDNPTITLKATQIGTAGEASFTYNWLAVCNGNGARKGAGESAENGLRVRLLGNPVENGILEVEVQSAAGQPLALRLTDLRGQIIDSQRVTPADLTGQYRFEMDRQSAGMYLLQVSTPTQMRTLKVLKR
ncbi:hypothetical protein GCM10028805_13660 [Spirosoma harenae]